MQVFRELSVIMTSFSNCIVSMWWSLAMLLFLFYVFALIFIQGLSAYVADSWPLPDDEVNDIRHYFGSVMKSILSLYMAVTGGNDWYVFYNVIQLAGDLY